MTAADWTARLSFQEVPANILAFCRGAQVCSSDCEDDCEDLCHEVHQASWIRDHQPDECPSAERKAAS